MRYRTAAYIAAIVLAGAGAAIASIVYPDNSNVMIFAGEVMLAVLTFPLGFVASAAGAYGTFSGFVTPLEALLFMTPVHAVLGYLQWCRLVPGFYRTGS